MKKNLIILSFICLFIVWGCASAPPPPKFSTPEQIQSKIPQEIKSSPSGKLVAIVGMENKSIFKAENLWDVASDLLTTRLVEIGYFRTVNWQRVKNDFDPVSLKTSSLVSTPEQLMNVRERLSADYFLGGAITFYDVTQSGDVSAISKTKTITTTVRVDLWLQDAGTGEYMSAASGNGKAQQEFRGGLLGGTIGTWDANVANKAMTLAIDDALIKLLKRYQERPIYETPSMPPPQGGTPSEPITITRKSNKWAIIVGIGQFADPAINTLNYTDDDAEAIYKYLINPNFGNFHRDQVFLMLNSKATTFEIKNVIDLISRHAEPEDTVFIFVSTHGSPGSTDYDVEGVGYIVTYDTRLHSLYATAFAMSDLVKAVQNRIKAGTVVTVMDTCYSAEAIRGTLYAPRGSKDLLVETETGDIPQEMIRQKLDTGGLGVSSATIKALSSGTGRIFITSSQSNEKSWESDHLRHGFFTYYLLDSLKKKGGKVSVQEAFDYLKQEVPKAVMKEKGKPQNPEIGMGDVRGDVFLNVTPK
ncbi:MAG: hypothetical protein BWK80_00980 [Desulfobacteraceae bacterium IS3]|nr:MAG: hypothetical protein BWK80_00980 [Desulfobacteraceae bacterium IS3]